MPYRLQFLNGPRKDRRITVQQGLVIIGRHAGCAVDLADDDEVSREHARIEERGDGCWIRDLGALNPTLVNGQPISEVKLNPGDKIEVGHTQLEFQAAAAAAVRGQRPSTLMILTFLAVALLFVVQGIFVVFQFAQDPIADVDRTPPVVSPLLPATSAVEQVDTELMDLRAAVAELRQEVQAGAAATTSIAVVTAAIEEKTETVLSAAPSEPEGAATPEPEPDVEAASHMTEPEPATPVKVVAEPSAREEEEDPLTTRARALLAAADVEVRKTNFAEADRILERIQIMAPDFLPAYVERARLHERRGQMDKAGEEWQKVMTLTAGSPLYTEAAAERQRLARAVLVQKTVRKDQAERPAANRLPKRIRLASIDRERLPGNADYDEMRLIRINLRARSGEVPDVDQIQIQALFYDRDQASGNVALTGASVPEGELTVDPPWIEGTDRTVTATYIVPKGLREKEAVAGSRRMYQGYRVRLFYRGELQDEQAQPAALMELPAPELSSVADRPVPR